MFESPVLQPFLHLLYEIEHALGLEPNNFLLLLVLLLEPVDPLQHEVSHGLSLLLRVHRIILYQVSVDFPELVFEVVGEAGDRKRFIGETRCQLVAL